MQAPARCSGTGAERPSPERQLCDQRRGPRPPAGPESCRVFLPGGLLRPQTEAIIGAAALTAIQQYNFTKAFMGANGVALDSGFTTPDPEEAAVKAAVIRRARETWFLVDDTKFAQVYPAVICDLHSGAILTNRCPNPKYRQYTLIKETEV